MENHRTINSEKEKKIPVSRAKTHIRPCGIDRNTICTQNGNRLGTSAKGNGLWFWNDLLAKASRLAKSWSLGQNTPNLPQQIAKGRQDRFLTSSGRFSICSSGFWGQKIGPNPTDRRKNGSKHHVITDANGVPFAATVTGANRHDITQLLPLVEAIPPIAGKQGRPRKRPDIVQGDRGYDSQPHRLALRLLNIKALLAKRRTDNGSGLGKTRWVVERTLAWLHQLRRLRVRYERRSDIHEAFLTIGCIIICWNQLNSFC
jgi:transposase